MSNILYEYIKNYDDFIVSLQMYIGNLPILLEHKKENAKLLNSDNSLLLKYYKKERKKLIKKISIKDFLIKVEIKDFGFTINKEELENQLETIKEFNFKKVDNNYIIEKEEVKHLQHFFDSLNKSVWIAFYNTKIEELKGGIKKEIPFYNPVFENAESKMFFEFLIKEWFNTLTKPKSAISFVFYIMSTNDIELPVKLKGLKYIIKDIRQLDFAYYWNENYKEIHKHKYEIVINLKTARLKTFSEIPVDTYINKLNRFVEKFENIK